MKSENPDIIQSVLRVFTNAFQYGEWEAGAAALSELILFWGVPIVLQSSPSFNLSMAK